jgi:hypothetical protein
VDRRVFVLDAASGVLQTNQTLARFTDGYFSVVIKASNGAEDTKKGDFTVLKVS